ncbi:MAG: hypothetical protein ACLPLP_05045, partial [Mycobacterium sp.]
RGRADSRGRADAQCRGGPPPGLRRDVRGALAGAGARLAEPVKLGPLIAAKPPAGQDDSNDAMAVERSHSATD